MRPRSPTTERNLLRMPRSIRRGLPHALSRPNKLAPSPDEVQSAGDELRQQVGINHDDDADDSRKHDGMPENEAEDRAFVANLIGRRGGNANRLRIEHLAHDATGAVGAGHENGAEMELLRGDLLQTTEEGIGRSIAAGKRDAKPPDVSAKEGKQPTGAGEGQTQDRVHARVSGDETQTQHTGHGNDGEAQAHQGSEENVEHSLRPEAKNKSGNQSGKEAAGSRGGEPIEVKPRTFGGGFRHDRSRSKHSVVKEGPVPSGRARTDLAVRHNHPEGWRCGLVHSQLEARQSPHKNDERQDGKGHPGPGNLGGGEMLDGIAGFTGGDGLFVGKPPDSLGLPHAEKKQRGQQGSNRSDNIHEIGVPVIGPERWYFLNGTEDK